MSFTLLFTSPFSSFSCWPNTSVQFRWKGGVNIFTLWINLYKKTLNDCILHTHKTPLNTVVFEKIKLLEASQKPCTKVTNRMIWYLVGNFWPKKNTYNIMHANYLAKCAYIFSLNFYNAFKSSVSALAVDYNSGHKKNLL